MDNYNKNMIERFRSLVKNSESILNTYHKEDDVKRLKEMLNQASSNSVSTVICGEFKRGKSSLINAFLSENVCPTDAGIATSVVSIIKYGEERKVTRYYGNTKDLKSEEIAFEEIEKYAKGSSMEIDNTVSLVISIPSDTLKSGLCLIDTPGVGGLDPRHLFLTLYALSKADITLFIVDAEEPLTEPEIQFFKEKIIPYSKKNKIILNKIDKKSKSELQQLIEDLTTKLSNECNVSKEELEVIPVSALQWNAYNKSGNDKMKEASNCDAVISLMQNIVPEYRTLILSDVKQMLINTLSEIIEILDYKLSQLNESDDIEKQRQFEVKLDKLKKVKNDLENPNSELRFNISRAISDSQSSVMNELTKQSIFSNSHIDTLLKSEEIKTMNEADRGKWLLQQINMGLEYVVVSIDSMIEQGFNTVISLLGKDIPFVERHFSKSININLSLEERSIADKAHRTAKQLLPGASIGGLAAAALSLFCGPVICAVGGLAAGIAFVKKSMNDSKISDWEQMIKTKLTPEIHSASTDIKSYIQSRYKDFEDSLRYTIQNEVTSTVNAMNDAIRDIAKIKKDEENRKKQIDEINKQKQTINGYIEQSNVLLTNPFV